MPKESKPKSGLTKMEEKFCKEYQKDFNQRQAAIRAGYAHKNSKVLASKMMAKKKITDRIMAIRDKTSENHDITVDAIILSLKTIRNKCIEALDGFEVVDGVTVESKHGPAYAAVAVRVNELMGQHIGMWPKKIELSVEHTILEKKRVENEQRFTAMLGGIASRKSDGANQTPRLVKGGKKKANNP